MRKIKFLLATIMMLVGVTATHAEDITSNITIRVSDACLDEDHTVSSLSKGEYTVKEGVVVTFLCYKWWDETVTIYLNGTAVATWSGEDYESEYVWTAKKDAKINWKGYSKNSPKIYLTETSTVAVTSITLDQTTASMTLGGETLTLTPTVLPADATDKTVTWTTSDASVATVADGVVTAVAPGTATITATATNGTADTNDDFSATCEVTVSPAGYSVALKSVTEDASNWQGKAGEGEYQELPLTGLEAGTAVSVKYIGTKKVKSVKAKKKQ